MIKDPEKRSREFHNFPAVPREMMDEIETQVLPQFLFYEKEQNSASVYCTACRRSDVLYKHYYIDGIDVGGSDFPDQLKHNEYGKCPLCGHTVQFKCEGRGHKNLESRGNFCIFLAQNGNLYIHAVKVVIGWRDIDNPETDVYSFRRYAFLPGESQAWKYKDYSGWYKMTTLNEPLFNLSGYMWSSSQTEGARLYTCINEAAIDETFLKYQNWDEYVSSYNVHPIRYLEFTSKYPQLAEQLCKCGFSFVIGDIVNNNYFGFRRLLNFRADGVKKCLGFNASEMRYWQASLTGKFRTDHTKGAELSAYLKAKEAAIGTPEQLIEVAEKYGFECLPLIVKLCAMGNITLKKVLNHIEKQSLAPDAVEIYISEWDDSLRMMDDLGYPKDSVLRFPKNLKELHERLIRETNDQADKAKAEKAGRLNKLIDKQEKELSALMYSNALYKTVLPTSIQDIVREGKVLDHCVASYAERHAKGMLHIFFIRKQWDPETPWYTVEVSKTGQIKQCYGFKDNVTVPKHKDVVQFEREYQLYLDLVFKKISKVQYTAKMNALERTGEYYNGGNYNGKSDKTA